MPKAPEIFLYRMDNPQKSSLLHLSDLSIAIVDDDPMICEMVSSFFTEKGRFAHVLTFQDAKSAFGPLARRHVDVALIDLYLQGDSGLHCIRRLAKSRNASLIIAYTSSEESKMIERALQEGAHGYLLKSEKLPFVLDRIQRAMAGEPALSAAVTRTLIGRVQSQGPNRARLEKLTAQENRVLALTADGLACKAVAEKLGLSINTVYLYNKRILKKLDVETRLAAVQIFREAQSATSEG
jgi:DNA-binding NarL/FixJ family response regulator